MKNDSFSSAYESLSFGTAPQSSFQSVRLDSNLLPDSSLFLLNKLLKSLICFSLSYNNTIVKEKIILTLVKIARKALFKAISIDVKTIATGERNQAQHQT